MLLDEIGADLRNVTERYGHGLFLLCCAAFKGPRDKRPGALSAAMLAPALIMEPLGPLTRKFREENPAARPPVRREPGLLAKRPK
jgi:hypothetical protein